MTENANNIEYVEMTSGIVASFVSNNAIAVKDIPELISSVHAALVALQNGPAAEPQEELKPAVPVKKSVTNDYIICLEDGKKFKSLKRHLRTHFNLSPEEYREKWGLPSDYPMVAPSYSQTRSQLARDNGLGRKDQ